MKLKGLQGTVLEHYSSGLMALPPRCVISPLGCGLAIDFRTPQNFKFDLPD